MDKPIVSIMEKHVITADIDDTVDRVEEMMESHKLSCVPVIDSKGNCFGVISSPDLGYFYAMRENPKAKRAWEVCTHKVIEARPDISVKDAAELMIQNKIHHIVVTENKSIKGIVSSIDLIRECLLKKNA